MNVSLNGMQLQCEADGRLLTFKEGNTVDVHLSIWHEGTPKKLTIPSWVRHVTANSIDVEFHQPDPELVDLIESYRVSEHHKLEASLGHMDRRTTTSRAAAVTGNARANDQLPEQFEKHAQKQNTRPFYSVVLATVFAVCVITGGYVYTASIDSRISTLETMSKRQSTELTEMQSRLFSASLQEGRYASLNARITSMIEAIISIENRLNPDSSNTASASLQDKLRTAGTDLGKQQQPGSVSSGSGVIAKTVDAPARNQLQSAPEPKTVTPKEVKIPPARPLKKAASLAAITRPESSTPPDESMGTATDSKQQIPDKAAATPVNEGPWVINLLSSRDKAYVERFSDKSDAAQYNAVLNSAMVNGKQYWRLQITGFKSAADAKNHAKLVTEQLGIQDVWIFKQK